MGSDRNVRELYRSRSEPLLNLGTPVDVKEGVVGIILARFAPKSDPSKIGYLVELKSQKLDVSS